MAFVSGNIKDRSATIILWDIANDGYLATVNGDGVDPFCLSFSPDGQTMAFGNYFSHTVMLWDVVDNKPLSPLPPFNGFTHDILGLSFSPDGQTLAVGSTKSPISFWNVVKWEKMAEFKESSLGHKPAGNFAFSPDGQIFASSKPHNSITLWNIIDRKQMKTLTGDYNLRNLSFSANGKTLTASSRDYAEIQWDIASGKKITYKKKNKNYTKGIRSPDGRILASDAPGNTLVLKDITSGKQQTAFKGHYRSTNRLSFSPNSKMLAFWADRGSFFNYATPTDYLYDINLWDVGSKKMTNFQGHAAPVSSASFSPDEQFLVSGSKDNTLIFWDLDSGNPYRILGKHEKGSSNVSFSPDGKTLASWAGDKQIMLWDVVSGKQLTALNMGTERFGSVSFSPNSKFLAVRKNHSIILWEVAMARKISTLKGHSQRINSISFSPDSRILASGSRDKTVILWDISSSKQLNRLTGHTEAIREVSFTANGTTLFSRGGTKDKKSSKRGWERETAITLWDVSSGNQLVTLKDYNMSLHCASFSPDGKTLVTGAKSRGMSSLKGFGVMGNDPTLILWDVDSGKQLTDFNGFSGDNTSVAFSPNGEMLATGSDYAIILWEVPSGKQLAQLQGHYSRVNQLAFTTDGKLLVSWGFPRNPLSQTIILWDVEKRQQLTSFDGKKAGRFSLSPDNSKLANGSGDGSVILSDLTAIKARLQKSVSHMEQETQLQLDGVNLVPKPLPEPNLYHPPESPPLIWPPNHLYHWLPSAKQGDADSMLQLGIIYHRLGNNDKAQQWYEKAKQTGHPEGEERLNILEKTQQFQEEQRAAVSDLPE